MIFIILTKLQYNVFRKIIVFNFESKITEIILFLFKYMKVFIF
ncbi:hypothetical protein CCAN12_660015 [Capnocytophaga canimorsus]|uniref:Uncharacterized protein n=1 Tax=Capnocytophaga canimorsus TaxID=28188 RepID=A0A0B7HFJ0_9FLAO|nr:hypothetical protein CCAN12_660015 [Capnocytophaga canimorsus]